jgi:hypothetical protein
MIKKIRQQQNLRFLSPAITTVNLKKKRNHQPGTRHPGSTVDLELKKFRKSRITVDHSYIATLNFSSVQILFFR